MTEKDTKNIVDSFATTVQNIIRPGKKLSLALFGASALFFGKVEAQKTSPVATVAMKQSIGDAKDAAKAKNFSDMLHFDFIDYNQQQKLVSAHYDVGNDDGVSMVMIKHFKKARKPVDINNDTPESSTFIVRDGNDKIVLNRKTNAAEFDISVNNAADIRFTYEKSENVDATIGALINKPRESLHKLIDEVKTKPFDNANAGLQTTPKMTL